MAIHSTANFSLTPLVAPSIAPSFVPAEAPSKINGACHHYACTFSQKQKTGADIFDLKKQGAITDILKKLYLYLSIVDKPQ